MCFSMRPIEEIIEDIEKQAQFYKKKDYIHTAGWRSLVLKTDYLLRILETIHQYFPDIQYITSYARADSITRKSPSELRILRSRTESYLFWNRDWFRPNFETY